MRFSIAGKTAIVTGAASGAGLAIARHFVDAGANVVFADMDETALFEAGGPEAEAEASRVRCFVLESGDRLAIANLVSSTIDAFDRIDIVVNASAEVAMSDPLDPEADAVAQMIEGNLMGALRLNQAAARRMIAQAEREERTDSTIGAIVNLASMAAVRAKRGMMGYGIACAAVEQMTRTLAVELAPHRVRVNGVAYGGVLTAALGEALRDHPEMRDAIVAATPLGRIAPAAELAETVQFLASDAADFITGQILRLDGGRSLLDSVQLQPS